MKSKGITLGEDHLRQNERGVDRSAGHGFNTRSLQDDLAARGSQRESQVTHPFPRNSGQRLDSNVPLPNTSHVKSNTTKGPERFHAGHGDTRGGFNETTAQAMDRSLEPQGRRAATADSPVRLGTQHPDLAVRSKPEEIAHADPDMGLGETFPTRGTMDR